MTGPRYLSIHGLDLALWTQPGEGPPVLFCHATGFHAHCWKQVIERLPGRLCYALDMRGHGLSSKPAPPYTWRSFGNDTAEVCRQIDLRGAIGVGHSMGGYSVTIAAAQAPKAFSGLLLADPVILPHDSYTGHAKHEHFARKRRNHWDSPEEMLERFRSREPFVRWDPAVLRDYCDHALLPSPEGGFVLACPPEVEAAIYEASTEVEADIRDEISRVDVPVEVMRAFRPWVVGPVMDMLGSPTVPELAQWFRNGRDLHVQHSHFIPLEDPQLIADHVTNLTRELRSP